MIDYLCIIGFWFAFGAAYWLGRKYALHPEWIKAQVDKLFKKRP
jgi:hypothetical protein